MLCYRLFLHHLLPESRDIAPGSSEAFAFRVFLHHLLPESRDIAPGSSEAFPFKVQDEHLRTRSSPFWLQLGHIPDVVQTFAGGLNHLEARRVIDRGCGANMIGIQYVGDRDEERP